VNAEMPKRGGGSNNNHTPRPVSRISEMWIVIETDDKGHEGVVSAPIQRGVVSVPLIAIDDERRDMIRSRAKMMVRQAERSGEAPLKYKMIRLNAREDIEDL
jgi:hypothetical protein